MSGFNGMTDWEEYWKPNRQHIEEMAKLQRLENTVELIKRNRAGVDRSGRIVDMKEHPEAVKIKNRRY